MTESTGASADTLCPSGRARSGSILLAVIGSDGRAGYLNPRVTVDGEFVARVGQGRSPGKRFRFAEPCVEHGCARWDGTRCGVIDDVLSGSHREATGETTHSSPLPRCSIRAECRWFRQSGPAACRACPWVITDLRPEMSTEGG
jgi:hypothetical protein